MDELEIDLGQEYHLEQIELLNKDKTRTRLICTGYWEYIFSKEYLL